MTPGLRPISRGALVALLCDWLAGCAATVRAAVDGPPCADPHALSESLVAALRGRGRPAVVIRAESFWRDASLRLEWGREDPDSYCAWLDAGALRREVLDPVVASGRYLPSLRDPASNRVTREPAREVPDGTVVIVSGPFLLGRGLPFDRAVHLSMSASARRRHTSDEGAWTLPAFDRYDEDVDPAREADVVVRLDDPRHPAVAIRATPRPATDR